MFKKANKVLVAEGILAGVLAIGAGVEIYAAHKILKRQIEEENKLFADEHDEDGVLDGISQLSAKELESMMEGKDACDLDKLSDEEFNEMIKTDEEDEDLPFTMNDTPHSSGLSHGSGGICYYGCPNSKKVKALNTLKNKVKTLLGGN